jgi:hypothetical protein
MASPPPHTHTHTHKRCTDPTGYPNIKQVSTKKYQSENTINKFKVKLFCDGKSVSQPVLVPDLYYCRIIAAFLVWGALPDERTGLLFSLPRPWIYWLQRSATGHSSTCHCIRLYTICWMYLYRLQIKLNYKKNLRSKSRRTHDHILLSHLRLPQHGGPGPCIYIPQEQGDPVIPPGTVFPFRRLLRLAGTTVEVF